ncbi:type I glyceraldehyde-3-phosphate dehydrogenase [Aurantivibrio plasticivorans]
MPTRIAINGFGRIGRCVLRSYFEARSHSLQQSGLDDIEIVAINELADCNTIAYLCKYDSTHGRFPADVRVANDLLTIDEQCIQILHEEKISDLPWRSLGIDLVLECTGEYSDRSTLQQHIDAGAKRVLLSQPGSSQDDVDFTAIFGCNDEQLNVEHRIISNASCSTNCIIPVIDSLHRAFGIDSGVLTTIHSAMNDQPVIDAYHHTDLRKTRSAIQSIIPVETGLAQGIDRLLPQLTGCFEAQAMRVPTINVSAIDMSVVVKSDVDVASVNAVLAEAASKQYKMVLGYSEELLASCDFNHDARSGIVDALQTRVAGRRLVKVLVWFDNEWGFSNRMLDMVRVIAKQ